MTLLVEIFVNNRQIAAAQVSNLSDLAEISDYSASWRTEASPYNREGYGSLNVCAHLRRQTPWALIAKVADAIARREADATSPSVGGPRACAVGDTGRAPEE